MTVIVRQLPSEDALRALRLARRRDSVIEGVLIVALVVMITIFCASSYAQHVNAAISPVTPTMVADFP